MIDLKFKSQKSFKKFNDGQSDERTNSKYRNRFLPKICEIRSIA